MSLSLWGVLYLSNKMVDRVRELVAVQLHQIEEDERLGLRKPDGKNGGEDGETDKELLSTLGGTIYSDSSGEKDPR